MRLLGPFCGALLISLALFWLMQWLVTPPEGKVPEKNDREAIAIAKPPPEEPESNPESAALAQAPPAPPAIPSMSLSLNASLPVPGAATTVSDIVVPNVKVSGGKLGGAFAGFAGGSGSGLGQGQGFRGGERLVPLSTARPQIPQYAHDRGIEGWVEVVFVVNKQGRVENIRIIDAEPKGVFEAAMVESIQNWIYAQSKQAREVKQRFEFKLGDFQYNWN